MEISPAMEKAFGTATLQLKKHAPVILTSLGVAGILTGGFLAAKNTLKLEDTIDESKNRIELVNEMIADGELTDKARVLVYIQNVFAIGKLYALPTTLVVGGILAMLGSQNILSKRNAALAAAYNGLAASYEAYRDRVREEVGEERESDLYHGLKSETVEDSKGRKTVVKRPVEGEHVGSPYRFRYDATNDNWTGFHDENLFRLQVVQNMYNDLLRARGHVFLRDVLMTLGIKDTPASAVTGWIYKEGDPNHPGDNFIEFNVRDFQAEHGYILLDFNVDGTIYDKI